MIQELNTADDVSEALTYLYEISHQNKEDAYKCVLKAQELNNLDLEFEAKSTYYRQLAYLQYYDEAIALYPWFLNQCAKYPDRFDYSMVLWYFKWIIDEIPNYHKISLAKLNELLNDFRQRFKDFGSGEKVILQYDMIIQSILGNIDESMQLMQKFLASNSTGDLDDCKACVANNTLDVYIRANRFEEVITASKNIVSGKLKCHSVPHITYSRVMYACMMLNKWQEAENYALLSRKKLKLNESHLYEFAMMIVYYTVTNNQLQARAIIQKQLQFAITTLADRRKFSFYQACGLFFESMLRANVSEIKIKFAGNLNFIKSVKADTYSTADLVEWFRNQTLKHALLLDERNQNTYLQNEILNLNRWIMQVNPVQ